MPELIIKGLEGLNLAISKNCLLALECDKLCSNARFELLAVCCSWARGRKANGPCLTRLQSAFVEVPSKVESAWTTFGARFKAGQRRGQKIANCLEVDFPAQRYAKFPRMQWGQILAAWLLG